ncbi:MAG: nucleotidyltransferase family protein [Gemmatimonadales bacterium]
MTTTTPTLADVQARLAGRRGEILKLGVRRLALFGSVRRNAARPDSDVDMLVEFQPGEKTFDHFVALGDLLEQLLRHDVELVTPEGLSPYLKPHILADAVDVIRAA